MMLTFFRVKLHSRTTRCAHKHFKRIVIKWLRTFIVILSFALNRSPFHLCLSLIWNWQRTVNKLGAGTAEQPHQRVTEMKSNVWQVWFCHLFRFATVKSSIHNHGISNCCCCRCCYSIQLHDRITLFIRTYMVYALFSLAAVHARLCMCVSLAVFFSRQFWCSFIISIQFEISGKSRQKNIRFLYLSMQNAAWDRLFCICIFMMAVCASVWLRNESSVWVACPFFGCHLHWSLTRMSQIFPSLGPMKIQYNSCFTYTIFTRIHLNCITYEAQILLYRVNHSRQKFRVKYWNRKFD